jgi:hypothetical protein
MKNLQLLLCGYAFVLVSLHVNAQDNINIHSITTDRMPTGDYGYTLDGLRMTGARAKLLEPANFGSGGTYPKSISIVDAYPFNDDLDTIMKIQDIDLFYFGTFDKNNPSLFQFSDQEIDSIYRWSVLGGKMIIGAAADYAVYNFQFDILNSRWGFDIALNLDLATTDFYSGDAYPSSIFNGPFGTITYAYQGGSIQGYFSTIPTDAIVLANDFNGHPTLILDCKTLDLILADGDGHNDLGGVTVDGTITSENDIFWTNTIVYMDSLQDPPSIVQNGNELSTGTYSSYQWLLDGIEIPGATSSSFTATENGAYTVEVSLACGCNHVSSPATAIMVGISEIPGFNMISFGPNPNKNGLINFSGVNEPVTVNIYDVLGRLTGHFMLNKQSSSHNINTLQPGIYTVKIMNGESTVIASKKLVRQ